MNLGSTLLLLALPAFGATISIDVSTTVQFGDPPCLKHSDGASIGCSSQGTGPVGVPAGGIASGSASMPDNSITFAVDSLRASSASVLISFSQTLSWYQIQALGDLTARFKLICQIDGGSFGIAYSIANNPVGTACQDQNVVSAVVPVTNGHVDIATFLGANESTSDSKRSGIVTLQLLGFQDASGNSVAATAVPEPATWGLLALGLLAIMVKLRSLQRRVRNHIFPH